MRFAACLLWSVLVVSGCGGVQGTEPPPGGWTNTAPTEVVRAVDREGAQLLLVRQGPLEAWVQVPAVGAKPGDYVLLGQGTPREGVEIPEIGGAFQVVDIANVQVVDLETAKRSVAAQAPAGAVPVGAIYAELDARAGQEIVVYGTAVKVTSAVGSVWIHIQDGTGSADAKTHDITVQAKETVTRGQRVAYRGVLKKDVDLGFGYHYDALVEDAERIE